MIYWFTGQPGSGKTTLASALAQHLGAILVDADRLRAVCPESYDEAGRRRNVARAQDIALYLTAAGYDVCVAVVAPYREQRDTFRLRAPLMEIYLTGRQERPQFSVDNYEPPLAPALTINTQEMSLVEALCLLYRTVATVA